LEHGPEEKFRELDGLKYPIPGQSPGLQTDSDDIHSIRDYTTLREIICSQSDNKHLVEQTKGNQRRGFLDHSAFIPELSQRNMKAIHFKDIFILACQGEV
jgi:hypothetical protein